jgi:hypothetical protein
VSRGNGGYGGNGKGAYGGNGFHTEKQSNGGKTEKIFDLLCSSPFLCFSV